MLNPRLQQDEFLLDSVTGHLQVEAICVLKEFALITAPWQASRRASDQILLFISLFS